MRVLIILFALTILHPVFAAPKIPTGLCINNANCTKGHNYTNAVVPETVNPENFHPGYYYSVGQSRLEAKQAFEVIQEIPEFVGGKRIYRWMDLEPEEGVYNFSKIEQDLQYLQSIDKRLWIQIFYTQFNGRQPPQTPAYMWDDPNYGCGSEYYGTYKREVQDGGWLPCFWNENLRARLVALYTALGERFNHEPYFEGIAVDETAIDTYVARRQPGYDVNELRLTFQMKALAARQAFPDKSVTQHINFAPYDLNEFSAWLASNNIGIGSPDMRLYNQTLMEEIYPIHHLYSKKVPVGPDVQWDNYARIHPDLGRPNTVEEMMLTAIELINPWYMFWLRRDPYFYEELLPAIRTHGQLPAAKAFYDSVKK